MYDRTKVTIFFITHDLEEAIFLGDRVYVLTTRPCRLKKVVNVDIPRPRNYEVLSSEQFRLLFDETKDAVHEEAIKAFQLGEKRASLSEAESSHGQCRRDQSSQRRAIARCFPAPDAGGAELWRGLVAVTVFLLLWEVGSRSKEWSGYTLPYVGLLPPPSDVAVAWSKVLMKWPATGRAGTRASSACCRLPRRADCRHPVRADAGGEPTISATSSSRPSRCCGRSRRSPGCRPRSSSGRPTSCRSRSSRSSARSSRS